jgi:hypothetical protein
MNFWLTQPAGDIPASMEALLFIFGSGGEDDFRSLSGGNDALPLEAMVAFLAEGFPHVPTPNLRTLLETTHFNLERAVSLALDDSQLDDDSTAAHVAATSAETVTMSPELSTLHAMFPDHDLQSLAAVLAQCPSVEFAIEVLFGDRALPPPQTVASQPRTDASALRRVQPGGPVSLVNVRLGFTQVVCNVL